MPYLVFVLCHGLLQLTQLLYSAYLKSSLTTIERRFGLSSFSSGVISSLHEVGNTALIVFVSYFGSRIHRPRLIGIGGLLMSLSAVLMALPHFLSQPYSYSGFNSRMDMCDLTANSSGLERCRQESSHRLSDPSGLWLLMACAQLLFGVGSVPIQPFGISYVDDFAEPGNSPLYIAILFAVSVFGPAFGYLLGSVMLRIYVDVDKTQQVLELTPKDPRWVGAWWMGLLISSACLALTSLPYFFFPRHMQKGVPEKVIGAETDNLKEDLQRSEVSLVDFLKMFPRLFVRLLLSPFFLLLVLSQCCFSSVIAGLATFLNKFLEFQYSTSAAYSNLLIGAINLPAAAIGMLLGGVIMKRAGLSMKAIPRFSIAVLFVSILLCLPLFFMGCSTQNVAGVNVGYRGQVDWHVRRPPPSCLANCSCPKNAFNPVCGSDNTEYISPCHAGCSVVSFDHQNPHRVQAYNSCSCIQEGAVPGSARPGSCANSCPYYLLPVIFLISLAGFIASFSHNPIYMMVLRYLGLQVGFKVMGVFLLTIVAWKVQRTRDYSLTEKQEGPV
ncbi:solute carrier organic anion transporter family member 2A1-like [Scleropages formosus]|uniref:Solute carrier organic anion transporter family member n=1 Tax=Scleropages formosus TaxID=113540 RepID=A0A0P7VYK9_SCLFO|nr:solute carrier organic anion transporter family member 2A1-like [Scleropages formosus]